MIDIILDRTSIRSLLLTNVDDEGAGESLRGTVGVAIDRAFGDTKGVEKNEAIAKEGEYEVQSGNIASSTKAREGIKPNNR